MSSSEGCYYISWGATAFGWTQLIPIIFTLIAFIVTAITNETIFFIFSWFLFAPQYVVWCFQYYFQYARPNPICQLYHTWAFPCMEAMYTGAIIGGFFAYAYFWSVRQSWISWFCIYCFAVLPPFILVYIGYNVWWEVVFSWGFGFLSAVAFVIVTYYFLKPKMHYLKLFFPLFIFGYQDTFIKSDKKNKSFQILQSLERVDSWMTKQSERS